MLPLHHRAGGTLGFHTVTLRTFVVQLASHSTNTGGCFVTPAKMNIMLQSNSFFIIVAALVRDFFVICFGFLFGFFVFCCLFGAVDVLAVVVRSYLKRF